MRTSHTARNVVLGLAAVAAILVALAGAIGLAVALFLGNVVSHIQIDPKAVQTAVNEAIVVTLKDGSPDQRLQMIHTLRDAGADAKQFVPQLTALLADPDPQIRDA